MTREQALTELVELGKSGDIEAAHIDADDILCKLLSDLGYEDVIHLYHKVSKWYA